MGKKKTRTNINLVGGGSPPPAAPSAKLRMKSKLKARRKAGGSGKKVSGSARTGGR